MKYLMFVQTDPTGDVDATGEGTMDVEDWVETYDASGQRIFGDRVVPAQDATGVRRRGGEVLVTGGPFSEARDWIVGFDVLECTDLEEAIAIAARHPMAAAGRIEIRPFWDWDAEESS